MITSRNYIKLDEKVNSITSIPPRAKILHGEICALSQTDGFCFASNKYFARRLNLSIQSVSRLIGALKRYKLITVSRITDDNGYRKRIIKPNSSITLSKISVGNAQKREKHTLKNANHNTVEQRLKDTKKYIGTKQVDYEYKHKECKSEIDEIDDLLAEVYELTDEELHYIKNFALKYRIGSGADDKNN